MELCPKAASKQPSGEALFPAPLAHSSHLEFSLPFGHIWKEREREERVRPRHSKPSAGHSKPQAGGDGIDLRSPSPASARHHSCGNAALQGAASGTGAS